jgi:hypothetical protein
MIQILCPGKRRVNLAELDVRPCHGGVVVVRLDVRQVTARGAARASTVARLSEVAGLAVKPLNEAPVTLLYAEEEDKVATERLADMRHATVDVCAALASQSTGRRRTRLTLTPQSSSPFPGLLGCHATTESFPRFRGKFREDKQQESRGKRILFNN